ncbi:MAG: class I SAM-dependent methyltransferase [Cytophagaceae bacterium]
MSYISWLLSKDVQTHLDKLKETKDIHKLILSLPYTGEEKLWFAAQLEGRIKATDKLPTWVNASDIIFPRRLSVEQSSSEITAAYKASLVKGASSLIDITGGFGVDAYFFSKEVNQVTYIEQQEELVEIVQHNHHALKSSNIKHVHGDGLDVVANGDKVDWIYADPARRQGSSKVVLLQDCEPDILSHLVLLMDKCSHLMIKASPMLEIKEAIKQLKLVSEVHVVAVKGECKEILFLLTKQSDSPVKIKAVDLGGRKDSVVESTYEEDSTTEVTYSEPLQFLYEPNAAIMKAGLYKTVAEQYSISKIHTHTHLYTSEEVRKDFPGRTLKILDIITADKKELKRVLPEGKANIQARNFPMTTEEIKKKLGIKDGGHFYIYATTLRNGDKRLLVCERV